MESTILLRYFLFIYFAGVVCATRQTAITFHNNSYKGLLVAIHPDVEENYNIIASIKDMFKEASAYLYTATGQRAFFGDLTILIPSTWTSNSSWASASSQLYTNADVVIKDKEGSGSRSHTGTNSDNPRGAYTQTYGRCGLPGVRIVLFTDIFGVSASGNLIYGPPGRVLVHEWAHFRWGVYDEHPEEGGPQFYFSPTTLKLEAVRCNINMAGEVSRTNPATGRIEPCETMNNLTGSFDEDCAFSPFITGQLNENITASIMDRENIPNINHFCNDDYADRLRVHNYESPSRHNRLCGSRSTWSVISESIDFQDNRNPPRDVADTNPTIRVVQMTKARRVVLAIDTSSSMEEYNKLTRATQAATYFIEDGLEDGVSLGIVTFTNTAKVVSPITELNTEANRKILSRNLPTSAEGDTSIAAALLSSIELLREHNRSAIDAFIILITDGQETTAPKLKDVSETIKESGAVVSVIAFGDAEEKSLLNLVTQTGGKYYYDTRKSMSTLAVDAMLDVYRFFCLDSKRGQLPVQVMSRSDFLDYQNTLAGKFMLDSSLGRKTRIIITYTKENPPNTTVTSPSGRRYCSLYPEYFNDPLLKRVKITVPDIAETGPWYYSITNDEDSHETKVVSIVVLSSGRDPRIPTLKFFGDILLENTSWPIRAVVVAEVTRSDVPVKALKVRATVNRPIAPPVILDLLDNGAGADAVKGDGVYSRFFTRFSLSGHYTVTIEMMNAQEDAVVSGGIDSEPSPIAAGFASTVYIEHPNLSLNNFERTTTALDEYPPIRISDLRLLHTCSSNGTVVLAWTASGDDLDYDKASFYSIVVSPSAEAIILNESITTLDKSCIIKGSIDKPKPFGSKEKVTLKLDKLKGTKSSMVFAVFAIDDSGNKAELSNLVTVGFGYVPDMSTYEYLQEVDNIDDIDAKAIPKKDKLGVSLMVGFATGILILTIVATVVIHITGTRKRHKILLEQLIPNKKCRVI